MRHSTNNANGPAALVITAPGINCDLELMNAFAAAGAVPESVLLGDLVREPARIDRYQLIGVPGGFSYGDDIAAGRIMGALMRREVYPAMAAAIERGVPVICPCNGFQIAVQSGLLPGPDAGADWPAQAARTKAPMLRGSSQDGQQKLSRMAMRAGRRAHRGAGSERARVVPRHVDARRDPREHALRLDRRA